MSDECGAVHESFPTFAVLIRPFSSVKSLMSHQSVVVSKAFPTLSALIRAFSLVNSLIFYKVGFVLEAFPAFAMLIRLYSSLDFLVLTKYLFSAEGSPTPKAPVITLFMTKGLLALSVPMWLPHTTRGQLLQKACAAQDGLPISTAGPISPV